MVELPVAQGSLGGYLSVQSVWHAEEKRQKKVIPDILFLSGGAVDSHPPIPISGLSDWNVANEPV